MAQPPPGFTELIEDDSPAPPPGFDLEVPAPPPGFDVDVSAPALAPERSPFREWQAGKMAEREQLKKMFEKDLGAERLPPRPPSEVDRIADEIADRLEYAISGYKIPPLEKLSKAIAPDMEKVGEQIETISTEHPKLGQAMIPLAMARTVPQQFAADILIPKTAEDAALIYMFPKGFKMLGEQLPFLNRSILSAFKRSPLPPPTPPPAPPEAPRQLPAVRGPTEGILIPKTKELAIPESDPLLRMIEEELGLQKVLEEKALLNNPSIPERQPFVEGQRDPFTPRPTRIQSFDPFENMQERLRYQQALEKQAMLNRDVPPAPGPLSQLGAAEKHIGYRDKIKAHQAIQDATQRENLQQRLQDARQLDQRLKSTKQLLKEINDALGEVGAVGPGGPPKLPKIEPQIRELVERAKREGYTDLPGIIAYAAREGLKGSELHKVRRAVGGAEIPIEPPPTDIAAEMAKRGAVSPTKAVEVPPDMAEALHQRFLKSVQEKMPPEQKKLVDEAKEIHDRFLKNIKTFADITTNDKRTLREKASRLYQELFNRFHGIEKAGQTAAKEAGPLPPGEDPKFMSRSYLGVPGKVQAMLEDGTFRMKPDGNIQWTGPGLMKIIEPVKGVDKDLDAYLAARAILSRSKAGAPTPKQFTPRDATIESHYSELQHPEFPQIAKQINLFGRKLLMYLYDSGRIGAKDLSRMFATHDFHVPLERVLESMDAGKMSRGQGGVMQGGELFSRVPSPLKRLKGTDKELEIIAPLDTMVKNVFKIVDAADRNRVALSIIKATRNSPTLASQIHPVKRAGRDTVTVYIEGLPHHFKVTDDLLLESMKTMDAGSMDILTKWLSVPSRSVRAGATSDPNFAVRNPFRDVQTAMANAKFGFNPAVDYAKGAMHFVSDLLGKGDLAKKMRASGGFQSYITDVAKGVDDVRNAPPAYHQELLDMAKDPQKWINAVLKPFEKFTELGEAPTRLGVAGRAKAKGASDVEAAFEMREATGDFGRRGAMMRSIAALRPFLNARMQIFDKTLRSFKDNPARAGTVTGLTSLISVWNWIANHKQAWYQQLDPDQKNLYWYYEGPKGLIRVPKGTIGQAVGSTLERTLDHANAVDPENVASWVIKTMDDISPMSFSRGEFLPAYNKPIVETMADYDFFRGRSIVPPGRKALLPQDQYGPQTSETMKELGYQLGKIVRNVTGGQIQGVSPSKLEHLGTSYFPGLGRLGLRGLDIAGAKAGILPRHPQPPLEPADFPILGAFVPREPIGSRSKSVHDLYRNLDRASRAQNSLGAATRDMEALMTLPVGVGGLPSTLEEARTFRPVAAEDRIKEVIQEFPEFAFVKVFQSASRAFADLNRARESVVMNKNMTDADKRTAIRQVEQEQTNLAEQINREFANYLREAKKSKLEKMMDR